MAMKGTLTADFSAFYDACQQAVTELNGFESSASKVQTSLNRMVDQFSGRKLIQDATLMAEAVERVGGVSKLTAGELERLGAKANEAIEKMTATGKAKDIPKELQNIADAANAAGSGMESFAGSFVSAVASIAAGFGLEQIIQKMIQFGIEIVNLGDEIQKIGAKTGISAEQVQRLQYVAMETGTEMDTLTSATQHLNESFADPPKGYVDAIEDLGLNFAELKKLDPYTRLMEISEAAEKITDPVRQAGDMSAIFGKTWKDMVPAVKAGMKDVADAATVMSDETVKQLAEAKKQWQEFVRDLQIKGGEALAAMKSLSGQQIGLDLRQWILNWKDALTDVDPASDLDKLGEAFKKVTPPAMDTAAALKEGGINAIDESAAIRDLNKELDEQKAKQAAAAQAAREEDAVLKDLYQQQLQQAKALDDINSKYVGSRERLQQLKDLQAAEDTLTQFILESLNTEKARADVQKQAGAARLEILKQEQAEQQKLLKMSNDALAAELAAQTELAKRAGGTLAGTALGDPYEEYARQMAELERSRAAAPGVSTSAREQLINENFNKAVIEWTNSIGKASEGTKGLERATTTAAPAVTDGFVAAGRGAAGLAGDFSRAGKQIAQAGIDVSDIMAGLRMGAVDVNQATREIAERQLAALGLPGNMLTYSPRLGWVVGRQHGGPVEAGKPYIVGEGGAELFVPTKGGSIVPHGGGGVTIAPGAITMVYPIVDNPSALDSLARHVGDAVMKRLTRGGVRAS